MVCSNVLQCSIWIITVSAVCISSRKCVLLINKLNRLSIRAELPFLTVYFPCLKVLPQQQPAETGKFVVYYH